MVRPSRSSVDHVEMVVPSPVADVKTVSSISTSLLNTLTLSIKRFILFFFVLLGVPQRPSIRKIGGQETTTGYYPLPVVQVGFFGCSKEMNNG